MTAPTPPIPSFTDGQVVHMGELNALGANLMNLYNENQGGFRTQRPCVIAKQTSSQGVTGSITVDFQTAIINTDNMWAASVPNQITIHTPGIYYVFSQLRYPAFPGQFDPLKYVEGFILQNGTDFSNSITGQTAFAVPDGIGTTIVATVIANLAAGSTLYLMANANFPFQTDTGVGGSFLGAIFLTPSA